MTEETTLSAEALIHGLGDSGTHAPIDLLRQAIARWPEVDEALLQTIETAGETAAEEEHTRACWAIYLAAHQRDPRALPLICDLATKGSRLEEIIGDGTTTDFSAILVRTYGGDPAPMRTLIEAEHADQFLRAGAIVAMVWLTLEGRIARDSTVAYLRWFYDHGRPKRENYVWADWAMAAAAMGLADFLPLVEAAFSAGLIDDFMSSMEEIRADFAAVAEGSDPFEVLDVRLGEQIRQMDDFVDFVSTWKWHERESGYEEYTDVKDEAYPGQGRLVFSEGTFHNPYRNVGRNDPCPCGSGKKFKKCCLGVAG